MSLANRIAAFGRPEISFAGIGAVGRSLEAARAWDAAHPEQAAERRDLVAQLERETKAAERAEGDRIVIERALRQQGAKLERSGVGERSLAAAADARPTEALGVVQRWLMSAELTWLALCGAKGTGKTVAAVWALREAIRGGGTGAIRSAPTLARLSSFDAGAEEMAHLKRVNLLVVDDYGTELMTPYAQAQMHELFDHRHEHYGRTILTSNLQWQGAGGMRERLGERVEDRLQQAGRVVQLSPEPSLRRKRIPEVDR